MVLVADTGSEAATDVPPASSQAGEVDLPADGSGH